MAIEHVKLSDPTPLGDTAGVVFTNPASQKTFVKLLWLANSNTVTEIVTLYYVPHNSGAVGTASSGSFMGDFVIAAGAAFVVPIEGNGWILENENDSIQAKSTTANKVNVMVCGAKEVL